jgi:hypothetical protein
VAHADRSPAALEVKLKAPNGVNFTAKGVSPHSGPVASSVCIRALNGMLLG